MSQGGEVVRREFRKLHNKDLATPATTLEKAEQRKPRARNSRGRETDRKKKEKEGRLVSISKERQKDRREPRRKGTARPGENDATGLDDPAFDSQISTRSNEHQQHVFHCS